MVRPALSPSDLMFYIGLECIDLRPPKVLSWAHPVGLDRCNHFPVRKSLAMSGNEGTCLGGTCVVFDAWIASM